MAKFNFTATFAPTSTIRTEPIASGSTYEGGLGYKRDPRSELFLLAVNNMCGEDTFYEKAADRDRRYHELITNAALTDWVWLARFLPWLRNDGGMRSAAVSGAMIAAKARLGASPILLPEDAPTVRQLVNEVLRRADEPGEALAYWFRHYGRKVPIAVKRGLADAAVRLYTERNLLKYDSRERAVRFGDVVAYTQPAYHHPEIRGTWRYDLLGYAIARRYRPDAPIPESLQTLLRHATLMAIPKPELRRAVLDPVALRSAGMTWEAVAGWLQGPMDAVAWKACIPNMGYFALLRNLRNFDEAGISDEQAAEIAAKLTDSVQIAASKVFPIRFLAAYRAAPSLRWSQPLETALNKSLSNIPALAGRTLILIDTSGSMNCLMSGKSTLLRWDIAALFGLAIASRCEVSDVVSFSGNGWAGRGAAQVRAFPPALGESLLKGIERFARGYFIGGGTDTTQAVRSTYRDHDRVVILTDEQCVNYDHRQATELIPTKVPVYTWNLAGYTHGHGPSGGENRHTFSGLNDNAFRAIELLENAANAEWPF